MKDEMAEKKLKALSMRRAGYSYDDIANELGYADRSAAWRLIHREYDKRISSEVAQAKLEELERLDSLQKILWPRAEAADIQAIETILRIINQRSKLLGLEKAVMDQKIEVVFSQPWGHSPDQDVEVAYSAHWSPRLPGGDFSELTRDPDHATILGEDD